MAREPERADDRGIDRRRVCERRAATDAIRSLEDERFQSRLCEEGRGDQTVMTGADDDDIERHHAAFSRIPRKHENTKPPVDKLRASACGEPVEP